jgi:MGT family glycosyltransferase
VHAILTPVGSAGDVLPFVVIGAELRRRGHRVSLLAPETFAGMVSNAGLEFVQVGTAEQFDAATNNPDLWHPRRGPAVVFKEVGSHLRDGYAALARVYEPDTTILVGHALSFFTRVFEETHQVPAVTVHLAPSVFRSDFNQSRLPFGVDMTPWPRWAKRAFWWAADRFAIDPAIGPALNAWRGELGLAPVSRIFKSWLNSPQRVLGLFPEWFAPPQPDWPSQLRLSGFLLSDHDDAAELPAPTGERPIVFTPGSANRHAARFFTTAIASTARMGRRAVLVTGYRDHLPRLLPDHVEHVRWASFPALFPRAAAVVHHGGIGTCAQALAAGVPQLLMPLGFDQPDNAQRTRRLGVGEVIPPDRFTPPRVAAALERLLSDSDVGAACRRWSARVDSADAVRRASDLIEAQFGAAGLTASSCSAHTDRPR